MKAIWTLKSKNSQNLQDRELGKHLTDQAGCSESNEGGGIKFKFA